MIGITSLSCYEELPELSFPSIRIIEFQQKDRELVEVRGQIIQEGGFDEPAFDEIGVRWGMWDTNPACEDRTNDGCMTGSLVIDSDPIRKESAAIPIWEFKTELDYGFNNYDLFWIYAYVKVRGGEIQSNVVNLLMRSHTLLIDSIENDGQMMDVHTVIGVTNNNAYEPWPQVFGIVVEYYRGMQAPNGADPRSVVQANILMSDTLDNKRDDRYITLRSMIPPKHPDNPDTLKRFIRTFSVSEYLVSVDPDTVRKLDTTYSLIKRYRRN